MAGKFSRSWQLIRGSWKILKGDKQLLLFPLFSGISLLLVMVSFAVPFLLNPALLANPLHNTTADSQHQDFITSTILLFLFYFFNYFIITFFNTGLISCVIHKMRGEKVTFQDGLKEAGSRLSQIAGWSLIAASIGTVLRIVENRLEIIGRVVSFIFGTAFSLTSFLVIPVMIFENKNPIEALKSSSKILRKTWGEQLISNLGFSFISLLFWLPVLILFSAGIVASLWHGKLIFAILLLGGITIYTMAFFLIKSVLMSIFQAGLYVYGSSGNIPTGFNQDIIKTAFKPSK